MIKDVGLLVNCGRWRLSREYSKRSSVAINFVTSVEVFDDEVPEVTEELRDAIQEVIGRWSRTSWRKLKKQERESKKVKHGK